MSVEQSATPSAAEHRARVGDGACSGARGVKARERFEDSFAVVVADCPDIVDHAHPGLVYVAADLRVDAAVGMSLSIADQVSQHPREKVVVAANPYRLVRFPPGDRRRSARMRRNDPVGQLDEINGIHSLDVVLRVGPCELE